MISEAKNYDVICFQLRNNLYSQLENPLKKDINRFSNEIKLLLTSGKKNNYKSISILKQVFDLRIKAIKWLATDSNFDYLETLKDMFPKIEEFRSNKKLEVLTENILFALRCNQRVVESLFNSETVSTSSFSNFAKLPEITYEQFLGSLALSIPDDEIAQKIADWTNSSLLIEFVMVATDIINDENLKISDRIINDLSFLISDAAQEYSALATELGFLRSNFKGQSFSNLSFDKSFIRDQKKLSDIGLHDFALNYSN